MRAPIGERDFGADAGAFDDGQLGQDHRMPKFLGSVGGDEKVHVGADVVGFGALFMSDSYCPAASFARRSLRR
ncbi:hypothetical protein, partial [Rhodococcus sp. LB1]|uniref:hypothetical protein n=1 Tax=Rhodococcus sp. LB1 TaxID=1807499 RepID=UPI000AB5E759